MKIQNRIILLLIVLLGLSLTAFLSYQSFEQKTIALFFENKTAETRKNLEKIIELKELPLKAFSYDYTYWDDMVTFANTFDATWAKQNIEPTLDSYDYDIIWVFDKDKNLGYLFADNDTLKIIPIPQEALARLADQHIMHFFLKTTHGLLEINAATIHRMADKERETPPQGFFLVGKIWNDTFLRDLSGIIDGYVTLTDPQYPDAGKVSDIKSGFIAFFIPLFDFNGAPIMNISATAYSRMLLYQSEWSQKIIVFFLIFTILTILIFAVSTAHWINRPLALINKALSADKPDSILPLIKKTSEWGNISRLILHSFQQREVLVQEVRERRKAQEASKKLTMALEQTDDSIFITDKNGVIEYVNTGFEHLTGYTKKEALGATPKILRSGKHDKEFYDSLYATILSGKTFQGALTNRRKDGHLIDMEVTITPLLNDQGTITDFVSVYKDITKQKELEKSQRLTQLGKLVSDISHEVNNPLQVISGHAEIALLEKIDNTEIKECLHIIFEQCQRAKNIIQRVLQFSKPGKNEIRQIDISSTIDNVLAIIEKQFLLANIEFIKNYAPDLPMVLVDEKQIQEVLMNLFNNARDAISGAGSIKITAQRLGQYVELRIKDSGGGMDQDTLAHLPEPFFSTKEKGTGLGIHICHTIIHAHGGELRFESQKGIGTTAVILLPIKETTA